MRSVSPHLASLSFVLLVVPFACKEDKPAPFISVGDGDGSGGQGGDSSGSGGAGDTGGDNGSGGGRTDEVFCEEPSSVLGGAGGLGGQSSEECGDAAAPRVSSPTAFRYDMLEEPTYSLMFDRPVCGAAENVSLANRGATGEDRAISLTHVGVGEYEIDFSASDWQPLDRFDLVVRRGISDTTSCIEPLNKETAIELLVCHPDGWPTAESCTASPTQPLLNTYCTPADDISEISLSFVCGKATAEGMMTGQIPPSNPDDPGLDELIAHTYRLQAPVAGEYTVILDGTSSRSATINDPDTLVAEASCDVGSCDDLGTVVQLDIGTSCGENDVKSLTGYDEDDPCKVSHTYSMEANEVVYLTVRPDADTGCGEGDGESCDYSYTLWVESPLSY